MLNHSTEKLIDLIKSGSDKVKDIELAADGNYQMTSMRLLDFTKRCIATLSPGFSDINADNFPTAIIAWGKCRVGSTALTNLFGMAGLDSYYQPVKTALRHVAYGSAGEIWNVTNSGTHIFAKEMAGPYLLAECLYNPIEILVEAGYPREKLRLIVVDRDPIRSLDSWINKWSVRIDRERLVQNYIISALNCVRIERFAADNDIKTVHFVYEASKQPAVAIPALFKLLGIADRYATSVIDDWGQSGALNTENAKVKFPVEPPPFVVPGLHGTETRYAYKERSLVSDADLLASVIPADLNDVYERHLTLCCSALGLNEDDIRVSALA